MILGNKRVPYQRKKGIWPFRSTFYSFCSAHQRHKDSCTMCQGGMWENDFKHAISSFVFKRWPDLWRKWANRPSAKARLAEAFDKFNRG